VNETVMMATQQDQVVQIGSAAVGPMDPVMGMEPTGPFTTREPATPIPQP
jgi:hypothetical protein